MLHRSPVWLVVFFLALATTAETQVPAPAVDHRSDAGPVADAERRRLNTQVFNQVVTTIDRVFYDPSFNGLDWRALSAETWARAIDAPDEATLYHVMTQLLDRLEDDHVNVQGPSVWAMMTRAEAPKVSAGISLQVDENRERIVDVRLGTPADRAGVQIGWWLDRIDGEAFSYAPLLDALPGQEMLWTLSDGEGNIHEVSLVLELPLPPIPPRRVDRPADRVVRLAFDRFSKGTADWFVGEVATLPSGMDVVLDLRGNEGGSLLEFRRIIGCFLPEGTGLIDTITRAGPEPRRSALGGCPSFGGQVVVLVDRRSTSAAELLPALLVEYDRAIVVGETTAGSVLNSQTYDLPDGGMLSVTRADLRTVGGQRLEGVGVTPTIAAVTTLDDRRAGRDPALAAALRILANRRAAAVLRQEGGSSSAAS